MIGIYKITEIADPTQFYVGKSNDIQRRFSEHKLKTYKQSRIPFDDYIKEKGINSFLYEVLKECSLEQLNEKERFWINKLNAKNSWNKFDGGLTNVVGSNNPNAKLTEEEVREIRKAYNNHQKQKEVYEKYKDKLTFQSFQNLWQGKSWGHIMPEVFTEENKQYYKTEQSKGENSVCAKLTDDEVNLIRQRYVKESAKTIYQDYADKLSYQAFQQILWGRYYKHLPVYKKKEKIWINN